MSQVIAQPDVDSAEIEQLRAGMRGHLLAPGDEVYDEARRIWSTSADRRPALIARCSGTSDVMRALEFARERNLVVAVRGGGHSIPGFSTCDAGMLIDLEPMQGIRVDPVARTVRAQSGATLGSFDRETQQFGLATTMGVVSTVGIAGLTLGGGFGWLMRRYGLASDNLISADVVTADGRFVTASDDDNADLFWGLRGGGGNFGVVTSFEYRLHTVGPVVMGGLVAYPPDTTRSLLRYYREFTAAAPDELTTYAALTAAPDGSPIAALAACYAGSVEQGQRALRGANAVATPVLDNLAPLPYLVHQSMMDGAYPSGQFHYWTSCFLDELTDGVIDVLVDGFPAGNAPPLLEIAVEHLGGAIAAADDDATAFGHRGARYDVLITANWIDPTDAERCVEWARSLGAALRPHSRGGGYVNYQPDEGESEVSGAYAGRLARLRELKQLWDPDNVFRLNQNIKPVQG